MEEIKKTWPNIFKVNCLRFVEECDICGGNFFSVKG